MTLKLNAGALNSKFCATSIVELTGTTASGVSGVLLAFAGPLSCSSVPWLATAAGSWNVTFVAAESVFATLMMYAEGEDWDTTLQKMVPSGSPRAGVVGRYESPRLRENI